MSLVTLNEAKSYLGDEAPTDAKLQLILDGISKAVETFVGYAFTTVTAKSDVVNGGGRSLITTVVPVTTITSVTDNTSAEVIDATSYTLNGPAGLLIKKSGEWTEGLGRYTIVYAGGQAAPDDVKLAILQWIEAVNSSKAGMTGERMGDYSYSRVSEAPKEVMQVLSNYRRIGF